MADFIIHFMEKKNVVMLRVRSTFRFNTSSAELSFPAQSFAKELLRHLRPQLAATKGTEGFEYEKKQEEVDQGEEETHRAKDDPHRATDRSELLF